MFYYFAEKKNSVLKKLTFEFFFEKYPVRRTSERARIFLGLPGFFFKILMFKLDFVSITLKY